MSKRWALFLLAGAVACGPDLPLVFFENDPQTVRDDYAIYSAALEYLVRRANPESVVLMDQTFTEPGVIEGMKRAAEVIRDFPTDPYENYEARNEVSVGIEGDRIEIAPKVVMLTHEELMKLHESHERLVDLGEIPLQGFWEYFWETHPRTAGLFTLSRPGLNAERDAAVLFVQWTRGGLCGAGMLLGLSKYGLQWRVVYERTLWIS